MRTRTRFLVVAVMAALLLVSAALPAFAAKSGMAGKSKVGHLYLFTKTPTLAGTPWTVVPGPWGKMTYKICPQKTLPRFVFNGHGLLAGHSYTLLNYTGFASQQNILGSGVADEFGNVHIKGSYKKALTSETPPDAVTPGAKIWLVDSSLLSSEGMFIGWDTTMILFEAVGIPLN